MQNISRDFEILVLGECLCFSNLKVPDIFELLLLSKMVRDSLLYYLLPGFHFSLNKICPTLFYLFYIFIRHTEVWPNISLQTQKEVPASHLPYCFSLRCKKWGCRLKESLTGRSPQRSKSH